MTTIPEPSVSVALCTYNGERFVAEQLRSILSQSRPVDQIVVADDGSSDRTVRLVEGALSDSGLDARVLAPARAPLGVTANFQRAIAATSGQVVLLCDQDDVWHPDRVALALQGLDDARALVHFTDARLVDGAGAPMGPSLFETLEVSDSDLAACESGRAFETLLRRNLATGATMALRRELLRDALPFPREWVHDEWLAILAAARERVAFSRQVSIDYRQHGDNQVGVTAPTLRNKISRVMGRRGERNRRLEARSRILAERLSALGASPRVQAAARAKCEIEAFRAALPGNRALRVLPVLSRASRGDYRRYCSQGNLDVLRDILQPE